MSKVLLIRVETFVAYDFGNDVTGSDIRLIPNLNLAPGASWSASLTDHGIVRIHIDRPGGTRTMMFIDFGVFGAIAGVQHYVVEADQREIALLKNRLGDNNVTVLQRALRARRPVRLRARDLGFKLVRRRRNGDIIGVRIPLVTCGGGGGSDLDIDEDLGETEDNIPIIDDLQRNTGR